MGQQLLPAVGEDSSGWQQTVMAFLAEEHRRSGSQRTVESYARMLWPFLGGFESPAAVTPAHVLAWAHGIGLSGQEPSSARPAVSPIGGSVRARLRSLIQVPSGPW